MKQIQKQPRMSFARSVRPRKWYLFRKNPVPPNLVTPPAVVVIDLTNDDDIAPVVANPTEVIDLTNDDDDEEEVEVQQPQQPPRFKSLRMHAQNCQCVYCK